MTRRTLNRGSTSATRTVFRNRWRRWSWTTVALPDGRRYEYTRLEPAGVGVGVIGFNAAGEVLLEREYRHGVGEVIWQIPGGLADEGEDLQAAGLRELLEETGYAAACRLAGDGEAIWARSGTTRLRPWRTATFSRPGAWSEWPAKSGTRHEELAIRWRSAAWLRQAVRDGEVRDRVVIAAVAYLLLNGWL